MSTPSIRVANQFALPLILSGVANDSESSSGMAGANSRTGEFSSRFAAELHMVLLSAMSDRSVRPSHVPLPQWEMLESCCVRRVSLALQEGRCVYLSKPYLRWAFSTLNRRTLEARGLVNDRAVVDVTDHSHPSDSLPAWATRGMATFLALAHRTRAVRFALRPRVKSWGLNSRLREIYLGESASTAAMARSVVVESDLPYFEFLSIYAKLVVDQRPANEPVEEFVAHMILSAANRPNRPRSQSDANESSRPGEKSRDGVEPDEVSDRDESWEEAVATHSTRLASQLSSMLQRMETILAAAAFSQSSTYPHLVDALKRICEGLAMSPACDTVSASRWLEFEGALLQLLALDVVDSTVERPLSSDWIVRFLQRLRTDYKKERSLPEVFAEILKLPRLAPDFEQVQPTDEEGYVGRVPANVGLVARKSARGWIGGAMLALLPKHSVRREIVMALATRRIGHRKVDSLAEIRDSEHFGKLLGSSLWESVERTEWRSRRELFVAVSERLDEWISAIKATRRGDENVDLTIVYEIPDEFRSATADLQSAKQRISDALELLDASFRAVQRPSENITLKWSSPNDREARALRAACFSVLVESLSRLARQLFVERRDWLQLLEPTNSPQEIAVFAKMAPE